VMATAVIASRVLACFLVSFGIKNTRGLGIKKDPGWVFHLRSDFPKSGPGKGLGYRTYIVRPRTFVPFQCFVLLLW